MIPASWGVFEFTEASLAALPAAPAELRPQWQATGATSDTRMTQFDISNASLRVALELSLVSSSATTSPPSSPATSSAVSLSAFDKLAVTVSKKAMRCYRDAHRPRAVAAMQYRVADLHLCGLVLNIRIFHL